MLIDLHGMGRSAGYRMSWAQVLVNHDVDVLRRSEKKALGKCGLAFQVNFSDVYPQRNLPVRIVLIVRPNESIVTATQTRAGRVNISMSFDILNI